MAFHPVLSPSPLEKAFCYVVASQQSSSYGGISPFRDPSEDDAENDLPPFWLSPPEVSLLRSAEENPLEYTLAEVDDAISYVRVLLKMLNQVTVNATAADQLTTNSRSVYYQNPSTNNTLDASVSDEERILTLDTPMFSEDEAFELYCESTKQHKRLVVAHFCVAKIYEIICVSLDAKGTIPSIAKLFHGKDNTALETVRSNDSFDELDNGLHTIHLEPDEWKPLLKILYSRSSDEYTKRGSAIILTYILKAGCDANKALNSNTISASKPDEDLLDLFSDDRDTTISPNHSRSTASPVEEALVSFVDWLIARLQQSGSLGVITPSLGVLMSTTQQARLAFVQNGGIGYISRHLRAKRQRPRPMVQRLLTSKKPSSRQHQNMQDPQSIMVPRDSPPSPARKRASASNRLVIPQSNSFASSPGSSVSSSNLEPFELDILPSNVQAEKKMDKFISAASEAATTAAAMARSVTPLVELATSAATAAMTFESPEQSSTKSTALSSSSVQQLYDLTFCLWCLSLDCSNDENILRRFVRDGAVPALAHLLKKVPREKVLRMTLACLQSLSVLRDDNNKEVFVREMIGCGLLKSLDTIKLRRWNDTDLEEDLDTLQQLLADRTEQLTQWSTYEAQITAGNLKWDDMFHTHDFFEPMPSISKAARVTLVH